MACWLMKSEPSEFSIDDLARVGVEPWDGVRNYQARNMMRDQMQIGDEAFFYHSNCAEPGIVGIMEIVCKGYVDDSAFIPTDKHYDVKSDPDNPRWYRVDVRFKCRFPRTVTLSELKQQSALSGMRLLQRGNRLSIMPVTQAERDYILSLLSPELPGMTLTTVPGIP